MKHFTRSLAALALAAGATAAASGPSFSQDYPTDVVRIITGVAAGGSTDQTARMIAQELSVMWDSPVIVEPRPGGGGAISYETAYRAPDDGYTILLANTNTWYANEFLRSTPLPFSLNDDFIPIAAVYAQSLQLVARNGLGVSNLQELLDLLKERGDELSYGSFGVGSQQHVVAEMLFMAADVTPAVHIPYNGSQEVQRALLAEEVDFGFVGVAGGAAMVNEGQAVGLAVGGSERVPAVADVPTLTEALGFPFMAQAWFVLMVRDGTPEHIVTKLREDLGQLMASADFQEKYLLPQNFEPLPLVGEALEQRIQSEREDYSAAAEALGITLE